MARRDAQARGNLRARQTRGLQPLGDIAVGARFRPEAWTDDESVAIMYWWALLSNFDASGPAVFASAMIRAFETHEEDPVRKCFFSITRDETNHEETAASASSAPGPRTAREASLPRKRARSASRSTISSGSITTAAATGPATPIRVDKYPLAILFTSFMMGEVASSTLFHGMSRATTHPVFQRHLHEASDATKSRHLQICIDAARKGLAGTYATSTAPSSPSSCARDSSSSR